ncbi:hypothetical protein ACH61_00700 [Rathayibacter tanaceti]|uniref:Uncharacterized protein n=1 Tax=Rathayibacter tanaceti TaxID=1671680 RepID=A0A166IC51_9MICO|nr:hypothetical protein ACH61_00700 [Rathayibacter tanaceti]
MSSAVARPAATAITETAPPERPKKAMATTAAALAPEVMPMMSGLASALRSIVWKITPPIPNPTPTSTAVIVRGRRRVPTVKEAPGTLSPRTTRITCGTE